MEWLSGELQACVEPVLSHPWILDIDVTIKPIYGRQQGAELGHNPHKPGRPSHAYHSYLMANTRLCLGVEVLQRQRTCGPPCAAGTLADAGQAAAHPVADAVAWRCQTPGVKALIKQRCDRAQLGSRPARARKQWKQA
jgi:hypothetical protein